MLMKSFIELLPTQSNKARYKREQQLLYILQNPAVTDSNPSSTIPAAKIDDIFLRLDQAPINHRIGNSQVISFRERLYSFATRHWDKGIGELTPDLRNAILKDAYHSEP